ncbi:McrC family protein [Nocardia yamanashiensis]|uniref:McrC family protein n=1 Tax=Nocardia yamanashiensis TaxID=209247 RepID=UPI000A64BDE8|nr:restriction endonuclease [Nocardia yamanashiensis]
MELTEHGDPRLIALTNDQLNALRALKCVEITARPSGDYSVKALRKVGSIKVGSLQLTIRPKITELQRILFFIGYSSNPAIWRDEFVRLEKSDGLYPAVAESFVRLADKAIERGVGRGYRATTDSIPMLRGRIRFREQLTRNYGLPLPIAVEYDDYTMDTVDNQLLLLATLRLLALPDIRPEVRRRLSRIRVTLDDVTLVSKSHPHPKVTLSRINTRYHDALRLAQVILDNSSFDQGVGSLAVSGFLFDMWKVYEDFVTGALSTAMQQYGGSARLQSVFHLDIEKCVKLKPDLVWIDAGGEPVAVVDAKYKSQKSKTFPEADLYQMLAYCSALGLKEGHLIYAKGQEPERTHTIVRADITIYCHALDLGLPPSELLSEIDMLASRILHR